MNTFKRRYIFVGCTIILLLINWWYLTPVNYENDIVLQEGNNSGVTETVKLELQIYRHWLSPTVVAGKMKWRGKDYISEDVSDLFTQSSPSPLKRKLNGMHLIYPFQEDTPNRVFFLDDPTAIHAGISFNLGELERFWILDGDTLWVYNKS